MIISSEIFKWGFWHWIVPRFCSDHFETTHSKLFAPIHFQHERPYYIIIGCIYESKSFTEANDQKMIKSEAAFLMCASIKFSAKKIR